jgi:hypothetical protein
MKHSASGHYWPLKIHQIRRSERPKNNHNRPLKAGPGWFGQEMAFNGRFHLDT